MSFESTVRQLLGGVEFDDPKLYTLLDLLTTELYSLDSQLNPPQASDPGITGGARLGSVTDVIGFTATIYPNNLRLTWNAVGGIVNYEIRVGSSSNWEAATSILTTSSTSADINPLTVPMIYGTYHFLIRAVSTLGLQSASSEAIITIPIITVPFITANVIDNNVLLYWTVPESAWQIVAYNVYKNNVFLGQMLGTFTAIFEVVSGSYEYEVEAVDMVGNIGNRGALSVTVTQPPDYELKDFRVSTLSGTLVNAYLEDGVRIIACVNTSIDYDAHFVSNGWAGPI